MDESIANRIARAVMEITENRPGYEVSFIRHGDGSDDPDWIREFAAEGGTAIVSGDYNILQHWPNLVAYTESGLISFFPPKAYKHFSPYSKAAFFLRWWPAIIEKIKVCEKGERWRLPIQWGEIHHSKMEPLRDPRFNQVPSDAEPTTQAKQSDLPLSQGSQAQGRP